MPTGSIVALTTPMDENGNVCRTNLKKLIDYHIADGTSAIVLVGTTGESATLSHGEHGDVVIMTLGPTDGRIPVAAGTEANAIVETVSLTKRFSGSGVIGCLTITPYYNRPARGSLFQHFKAIAGHTDLPQILYNVPPRTDCDILPETVDRLAEIKDIVGIREATGSSGRIHQIKGLVSDDFILLSDDDAAGMDFMQFGGMGVIPVATSVATREMADMCRLALAGQLAEAHAINQRLMPLHTKLLVEPNSIPVKQGCKALGLVTTGMLRLPMMSITDYGHGAVAAALKHAGSL